MKVLMVTGSFPPDFCGVGAYTENLVRHLRARGLEISVASEGPWLGFKSIATLFALRRIPADITHIQYPAVGFGQGLAAQLLCLMRSKAVVTIHETSQVHFLRRLALIPFFYGARHLIFTNEFERHYAKRFCPWLLGKSSVIPLGSSIVAGGAKEKTEERIVHFGLIRPQKGIENVLEAARLSLAKKANLRFLIVGTPDKNSRAYSEDLKNKSRQLPVDWQSKLPDDAVSDLLSRTRFAYMPFPDGATERRTSLLALYANGVVVATTASKMTSPEMKEASVIANSPEEAVTTFMQIAQQPDRETSVRARASEYIQRFSWEKIAEAHQAVYDRVLGPASKRI